MEVAAACPKQQECVTPELEHEPEAFERIMSFQMPEFVERFAKKHNATQEEAQEVFQETLRFLYLCRQGKGARFSFAPSPKIDEGWHNFILFTKEYKAFCEKYIGWFIHHQPVLNGGSGDKYQTTYRVAERIFGSLNQRIWPAFGTGACQVACAPGDPCSAPAPDPD